MKTDEELKQLALDLLAGKVYTDRSCRNALDLQMVFLPLASMQGEPRAAFMALDPQMLYEYLDKAGPRSFNGMPSFTSFQHLNKEEMARLVSVHTRLKAALKEEV